MSKRNCILSGFLSFVLLVPLFAGAQFTDSKMISKRYSVSPGTKIEITNKYGRVKINTWKKDSVVFEIKVKVEDKKLSKLEKTMGEIDFDFSSGQHYLIARTRVGENRSTLEREVINLKETLLQSDGKIDIDFTVWMPDGNPLKVENKFGDIFMDDYSGELEINLSNGNLKAHDFTGKTTLTFNFADATINQVKNARINSNYSELYIKKAERLNLTGKSSEFDLDLVKELTTDSRRDKFRIQEVTSLNAKGSFTNYRIDELIETGSIKTEYGDIFIEKVNQNFKSVYIESKSVDCELAFHRASAFGFEILQTKSQVSFAPEIKRDKETVLDEKEKKIETNGTFGSGSKVVKLQMNVASGQIRIDSY